VVVTYTPDGTYGHPDHVKAHLTTVAALELLAGEGWEPEKFYLHAVPRGLMEKMAERWRQSGLPEPDIQITGIPDEEITATVDVRDLAERKRQAFAAHVSQNNPESPFVTMGDQIFESAFGSESYVLAGGRLAGRRGESDLFADLG
jgi:N-acetyl-1-D-myo-inositol-2-amino-2-deoxy-alpha-D-glucopyranoside deacetylase